MAISVEPYPIKTCPSSSKLVTAVDELKWPDCGNTPTETEKNAEVEKSDYVNER
jgi:hypothetical protein